jgi:transposase
MKALDRDLRERIVRAVERGESMPSVAARFEVSPSTVKKLKYRQRDTGSTEPKPGVAVASEPCRPSRATGWWFW